MQKMQRIAFFLFLLINLLLLPGSLYAGYISLKTEAEAGTVTGDIGKVRIRMTNLGNETAHKVRLSLLSDYFNSIPVDSGDIGINKTLEVNMPVTLTKPMKHGNYPIVLLTEYVDAIGYPLSLVYPVDFAYKTPSVSKVIIEPDQLNLSQKGKGDLKVKFENMDLSGHKISVKLYMPNEFSAVDGSLTFDIGPKEQKEILFKVNNKSGLPGSSYAILLTAEYDDTDKTCHYSSFGSGLIQLTSEEIFVGIPSFVVMVCLVILAIIFIYYVVVRKKGARTKISAINKVIGNIAVFAVILSIWGFLLLYFRPSLILSKTITTGGDMASHYYPAEFLRNHLIPNMKIAGWAPGWLVGFPVFQYYFPFPYLIMAFLSYVIPLQIAFKLVTVLGIFLLPLAIFISLKLMRFERPAPLIGAIFALPFLFMEANSMWGGNIPSTLSGEFSYSLGLSLSIIFIGSFYRGLREKKNWIFNGVLFSLILLSHATAVLWIFLTSILMFFLIFLECPGTGNFKSCFIYFLKTFFLSFLLTAFWTLPLLKDIGYTSSNADTWHITIDQIFPKTLLGPSLYTSLKNPTLNEFLKPPIPLYRFVSVLTVLIIIAITVSLKRKDFRILVWFSSIFASVFLFYIDEKINMINIRFVPFLQIVSLVIAAIGFGYLFRGRFAWLVSILIFILVVYWAQQNTSYISFWIKWNYSGFESKALWPAFSSVNNLLKGNEGMPRVVYEHSSLHDEAGTRRAFESLPVFSGRSTLEGLLKESSISSLFIFYIQSEIGPENACPVYKRYPGTSFNLERGIEHMKLFNVQHFIARSEKTKEAARKSSQMKLLAVIEPYEVYKIINNENRYVIVPDYWPVQSSKSNWKDKSYEWFKGESRDFDVPVIFEDEKIDGIQKVECMKDLPRMPINKYCRIIEKVKDGQISFTTNSPGMPHLIRVSYHPNWKVRGAKKIYLASPSFMIVFPEGNVVKMRYERSFAEYLGIILGFIGLIIVIAARRRNKDCHSAE